MLIDSKFEQPSIFVAVIRCVSLCILELLASQEREDCVSQSGQIPIAALVGTVQSLV